MSSLTQETLGGMLWMSWAKMVRGILQVGVLAVLARLVSPAEFGVVNAALVVVEFSTIFTHIGLGKALIQHPAPRPQHIATALWSSVVLGILLGAIVWAAAPMLAGFFRIPLLVPVLRLLAWSFPLKGVAAASEAVLFREFRFRWLATRELVSYAIGYGMVGVVLAWLGFGVWALVSAHFAQTIVNTVLLLAAAPMPLRVAPERAAFKELAYFGGGFTLARMANYAADQADTVVVGRALGAAALGLYGRAAQLVAVPAALFGDVLDNVLFPTLARLQQDATRLAKAYRCGVSVIALVMLPSSVTLLVLAPELVDILLGPRWSGAVVPFRLFSIGLMLRASSRMSDALARATGAVYRRAWRQWIFAGLVIAGASAGQRWGIAGAALGVVFATAANFCLMSQLSLRLSKLSWRSFAAAHAPAVALSVACGMTVLATKLLMLQLAAPSVIRVIASLVAAALTVVALTRTHPRVFLGNDGLWMWDQLQIRVRALRWVRLAPQELSLHPTARAARP
jgi:O-antigen/teichoic acid export membrane protein